MTMLTVTRALIDYWHRLPVDCRATRRLNLTAIAEDVRRGCRSRDALLPYALGDVDAGIVLAATVGYVAGSEAGGGARCDAAVHDALEWIRRGLALNRGAVFAALLEADDASINERLAAHRLSLTSDEVAAVCHLIAGCPGAVARRFLADWLELLDGATDPASQRQHGLLRAALGASEDQSGQRVAA